MLKVADIIAIEYMSPQMKDEKPMHLYKFYLQTDETKGILAEDGSIEMGTKIIFPELCIDGTLSVADHFQSLMKALGQFVISYAETPKEQDDLLMKLSIGFKGMHKTGLEDYIDLASALKEAARTMPEARIKFQGE